MKYFKDFDFQLSYHPEKINVVADALSRKSNTRLAQCVARLSTMSKEIVAINPIEHVQGLLANLVISNDLVNHVNLAQALDQEKKDFMKSSLDCSMDSSRSDLV